MPPEMFHFIGVVGLAVAGVAFLWLVVAKPVTRVCRALGVRTPCPFWLGWILLIRPGRWRRQRTLDRIGIRPGERVLEIGAGVGVFTAAAARRAGTGRLVAIDVQPQMVRRVRGRLRREGASDLAAARVADARDLPFDNGSFDRVFLVSALPEMPAKGRVLAEIRRVLAPGGVLSISEEFFDPEYRLPRETVRRVEPTGFRLFERHGGPLMYTLNFVSEGAVQ